MNSQTSRKKKILIHSNFCKAFTGFGKHKKNLLKYLYNTGKYEIVEVANAKSDKDPEIALTPWKTIGTLPSDPMVLMGIGSDPVRHHAAGYGHELIDEIIEKEKPDIYLGIEDIWAFEGFTEKKWWNKLTHIIHTTLDSVPIYPPAIQMAPSIKNYFVWASFAEKSLKKLGHDHVKTVRGIADISSFFKLSAEDRSSLRTQSNLTDSFVIGFVFRNQLRKSVPNLLDGFKKFQQRYPKSNPKLYLHTNWSEQNGWDIPRLIKEKNIDHKNILTTYICNYCNSFFVYHYIGENKDCPFCKKQKSTNTVNIQKGVSDKQLNQIYNLLDVYCHPFTSGGQEIPVQEAKAAELITLVTNYSCGEDNCTPESGGLPLKWNEYREAGTQFVKASTDPDSIFEQLKKVYHMPIKQREQMGKKARKFVVDNFSTEVVGKIFEDVFDKAPLVDWSEGFSFDFEKRDPFYIPKDSQDDIEWLKDLYKNCLKMRVETNNQGLNHWLRELRKGSSKKSIIEYFHGEAIKQNKSELDKDLKSVVNLERPNKRIAYVMPEHEEDIILSTSVVKSLKKSYPNHDIYFFTLRKYFELLDGCEEIYKVCAFKTEMDHDCFYFIGKSDQDAYFDLAFFPYKETKKSLDYSNHGRSKLQFDLK